MALAIRPSKMPTANTSAGSLYIPGQLPATLAKVHPLVLFNICDSHIRRNEGAERVIGTLLGSFGEDGVVIVKNAYAVPHNESQGQVAVDIDFHRTMFELHHRVNPKEVIVGWYSTGGDLMNSDALIQDFYSGQTPHPVHLTVDTNMNMDAIAVKAFLSTSLTLGEKQIATHFHEIAVEMRMAEADRVGIELLRSQKTASLPADLDGLQNSINKLQAMIDETLAYVDGVVETPASGNKAIGRYLMDTLASVPRMNAEAFSKLFNESVQDVLLVMYLANMTRTQLILADKLSIGTYGY